jgi:hypothetical protein
MPQAVPQVRFAPVPLSYHDHVCAHISGCVENPLNALSIRRVAADFPAAGPRPELAFHGLAELQQSSGYVCRLLEDLDESDFHLILAPGKTRHISDQVRIRIVAERRNHPLKRQTSLQTMLLHGPLNEPC